MRGEGEDSNMMDGRLLVMECYMNTRKAATEIKERTCRGWARRRK